MTFNRIKIPRRTQSQWLIWCLFFLPSICPFFTLILKFPTMIRYSMDICWGLLLVLIALNYKKTRRINSLCGLAALFFCYAVLVYLPQFQSALFLLWGVRNNFRFYVFFIGVACFLREKDKSAYIRYIDVLFWLNAAASVVQFFLMGYRRDNLGGLFGTEGGTNGYTNILLVVYLSKTVIWYLNGSERAVSSFTKILICMMIAAFAELKFYYVEAVVIILLAVLITRSSARKISLVLFSAIAVLCGLTALLVCFPDMEWFLQLASWLDVVTSDRGYSSVGDLNRVTAIPIISETIFQSIWQRIFGLGLGNCETATYSFLATPFYRKYENLHYYWFSSAFIFVEMGWVGLVFFFGFFCLAFWKANKLRRQGGENQPYCQLGMLTAAMCVLIGMYNVSLRTEAGYMAYFVMALPFVRQEQIPKAETAS